MVDALLQLLDGVPAAHVEDRLAAHLLQLPGWSSYVKWRSDNPVPASPITLADLLAVRLTLSHLFAEQPPKLPAADASGVPDGRVWLEAWEESYRRDLTAKLAAQASAGHAADQTPEAQLVFCIDVRSEVLRRHLEAQGPYETLGFAGFFGAPVSFAPFDEAAPHASCPALLTPRHTIPEVPAIDAGDLAERARAGMTMKRGLVQTAKALKASVAGAFAFVEATGAVYGAAMVGRTVAPRGFEAVRAAVSRAIQPPAPTEPKVDLSPCGDGHTAEDAEHATGLSPSEQAFFAETALTVMGLTEGFAPIVVLCGHGGETQNNPFASGLWTAGHAAAIRAGRTPGLWR
ncbi:MAG: putative inorganic carbon transporter subunit DabA [Rhodovibrio sp.]|nr:putative inorganic carbon transporter subunit DabA [Rhodovibrio sp.]